MGTFLIIAAIIIMVYTVAESVRTLRSHGSLERQTENSSISRIHQLIGDWSLYQSL